MPLEVNLQSARSHEGLRAIRALKWPVTRMASQVIGQVSLCSEGFLAAGYVADERLLSRVDTHVCLEVPFLCESFPARLQGTNKWFLSGLELSVELKTVHEFASGS